MEPVLALLHRGRLQLSSVSIEVGPHCPRTCALWLGRKIKHRPILGYIQNRTFNTKFLCFPLIRVMTLPVRTTVFLVSLASLILLFGGPVAGPSALGAQRTKADGATALPDRAPNVILIMADDLGYGDLGAYGQEQIQTPNLDRMAREGTRFTQFYAGHTVCAPSRNALFLGRHTGNVRVRGNVFLEPRGDVPLRRQDTTIVAPFEEKGYMNGVFGKWALGLKHTSGAPHRQGFDAFLGYEDQSEAHNYYVDQLQGISHGVTVNVDVDTTQYSHDLIAESALHFIDEHRDERFFLYLPVTIPHAKFVVPEESLAPYLEDGESIFEEPERNAGEHPHPNATYAAMISRLDRDIGRILDRIKQRGLAENTIVLFTSDNGGGSVGGHRVEITNSNAPFRGEKRDLYEGGIRVPMIAWGPGTVPAGRTSDQIWAAWDLLPTFAELVGIEPPANIDGQSMAQVLTGEVDRRERGPLYWEYFRNGTFRQAVRKSRWKAIRSSEGEGATLELYDLREDPDESNDLSDARPEVAQRMETLMRQERRPARREPFQVPWVREEQ